MDLLHKFSFWGLIICIEVEDFLPKNNTIIIHVLKIKLSNISVLGQAHKLEKKKTNLCRRPIFTLWQEFDGGGSERKINK